MRRSASWAGTPPAGFVGARRRRFVPCLLLFLGAVAGVAEAQSTQLTVRVRQPNGSPISLATVCMAQGSQAGSRLTDSQGVAVLTGLPAGAYSLHVIKSTFQTVSDAHYLSGTQERIVTLQPGASTSPAGVNCQVGGAPTTLPPITITSFRVDNLPADFKVTAPPATTLPLRATFDQQPAFFRIKEAHPDAYTTPLQNLRTASWQPILAPNAPFIILFPIDFTKPFGTRVIYLQVSHVASEDAASQIKSVSVVLTPATLRTSVLTGAALQGFLDRAQQQGYGSVRPKGVRTDPDLSVCPAGRVPVLVNAETYSLLPQTTPLAFACNSDLDCPINLRPCQAGACSARQRVRFYLPLVGWFYTDVVITPPAGQLAQAWPKGLIEKAEYSAFAGPPLNPFWKITDLKVLHDWVPLQPAGSGGWPPPPPPVPGSISVGGYNMVNTPLQPPIQDPERSIRVERTTQFPYRMRPVCLVGTEPPSPPLPRFLSVTVVGPDGRDPLEAFPPRGPTAFGPAGPLFPIPPPGTLGPFRP